MLKSCNVWLDWTGDHREGKGYRKVQEFWQTGSGVYMLTAQAAGRTVTVPLGSQLEMQRPGVCSTPIESGAGDGQISWGSKTHWCSSDPECDARLHLRLEGCLTLTWGQSSQLWELFSLGLLVGVMVGVGSNNGWKSGFNNRFVEM